jgi:hypothetical protein
LGWYINRGRAMPAFEFSTVLENGYIYVPEIYSGQIKSPVQVIILAEEALQPHPKSASLRHAPIPEDINSTGKNRMNGKDKTFL